MVVQKAEPALLRPERVVARAASASVEGLGSEISLRVPAEVELGGPVEGFQLITVEGSPSAGMARFQV